MRHPHWHRRQQPLPQPTGSLLYTVTIPVDDVPANNIVFQGVETYIPGGGLDPVSLVGNFVPGSISLFTRQWGKAIEQLRGAIDLDPNYWLDHVLLGRAYEQQGKFSAAIDEFQKALKLDEDHAEIWSALGHARTVSGNAAEARKIRDRLQSPAELSYVAPYNVAIGYAGLGDKEQTFAWLRRRRSGSGRTICRFTFRRTRV